MIDSVTFDSPIHLSDSVLGPIISRLKKCEFDSESNWLDEILEMWIRGTWQDEGYFTVRVDGWALSLGGDASLQHFSVKLHVDEGPQYRMGNLTFRVVPPTEAELSDPAMRAKESETNDADVGPSARPPLRRRPPHVDTEGSPSEPTTPLPISDPQVIPVEQLRQQFPLHEGDILRAGRIRKGLENFKHLYANKGYIDFTATPFTEVDKEHQTVDIRIDLDEELQYHVGKVEIQGLDAATQSALVWQPRPGDIFDYERFNQFFEDNKSLLPEGSSDENAELRRDRKKGTVDIRMRFRQHP